MPYSLEWVVEKRVYLMRFYGDFTLEELKQANQDAIAWIRQGPEGLLFHIILDTLDLQKHPMTLKAVAGDSMTGFRKEPNLGWVLLITESKFISFLASITTQLTSNRFRPVSTFDEAVAFLREQDQTINWAQMIVPDPKPGAQAGAGSG